MALIHKHYWRIHLRNGEVIDDIRCHDYYNYGKGYQFRFYEEYEVTVPVTEGTLWWKKTVDVTKTREKLLYTIPERSISYVEKVDKEV